MTTKNGLRGRDTLPSWMMSVDLLLALNCCVSCLASLLYDRRRARGRDGVWGVGRSAECRSETRIASSK